MPVDLQRIKDLHAKCRSRVDEFTAIIRRLSSGPIPEPFKSTLIADNRALLDQSLRTYQVMIHQAVASESAEAFHRFKQETMRVLSSNEQTDRNVMICDLLVEQYRGCRPPQRQELVAKAVEEVNAGSPLADAYVGAVGIIAETAEDRAQVIDLVTRLLIQRETTEQKTIRSEMEALERLAQEIEIDLALCQIQIPS